MAEWATHEAAAARRARPPLSAYFSQNLSYLFLWRSAQAQEGSLKEQARAGLAAEIQSFQLRSKNSATQGEQDSCLGLDSVAIERMLHECQGKHLCCFLCLRSVAQDETPCQFDAGLNS